jgi:hypothetical protein
MCRLANSLASLVRNRPRVKRKKGFIVCCTLAR